MNDATAGGPAGAAALSRRRILQLALLVPASATVLGGCGALTDRADDRPDPLIALADAARADAALAAAAVAAQPALAARIEPLRAARTEHASALDAEVGRLGGTASAAPPPSAAPAAPVTLAQVREAVAASQVGAAELVEDLPAERVGLVAAVAACCATYAAVLA